MDSAKAAIAERQQKHAKLNEAIEAINDLRRHAADLLNSITNHPEEIKTAEEGDRALKVRPPSPSLEIVLNEGPDRIRNTCEQVHELLNKISTVLF